MIQCDESRHISPNFRSGVTIKTSTAGLGNLFPIKNESLCVFVKCRANPPVTRDWLGLNTEPDWTTIT